MNLPPKTVSSNRSVAAATDIVNCAAAIILTALAVIATGCSATTTTEAPAKRQIGTVNLTVDFGGAVENVEVQIPCSEDSTVIDILRRAEINGDIKLQSSGNGETAFVESINGVSQQSSEGKYWTYQINNQLAKTGSGVTEVDPGDNVQWRFGTAPPELQ